jgi:hypothetical protein
MASMPPIVGYVLGGHDITVHLFDSAPDTQVCPHCKSCLDRSYIPPQLKIPASQRYGFGGTRDLQLLFSTDLIKLIGEMTAQKFELHPISRTPDYAYVIPHDLVEFDLERRATKIGPPCSQCMMPTYVVGATPAYLKCRSIPDCGFFRTDIEFGGENGKSPLIVVGKTLKDEIESRHFRGVYFKEAYGLEQS